MLEACSLLDLLICHYLNRLLEEIDPEEFNSVRTTKKRKSKMQDNDNFSAIAKVGDVKLK